MEELPIRPSHESTCSRMTEEWWEICLACWHREPEQRLRITDVLSRTRNIEEVGLSAIEGDQVLPGVYTGNYPICLFPD